MPSPPSNIACWQGKKHQILVCVVSVVSNVFLNICILTDIDECVKDATICGPNCNCTNSIGSYNCTCFLGYRLNNADVIASVSNPCTGTYSLSVSHLSLSPSYNKSIQYALYMYKRNPGVLSSLQILMSALRHLVYVVKTLYVLMYRGPSFVLVVMDSTPRLESCGWLGSHFVKVSKPGLKIIIFQKM